MTDNPQALYNRLGHAISVMPDLNQHPYSRATLDWIGEIDAIVAASRELVALAELRVLSDALHHSTHGRHVGAPKIYVILQRVLRTLEMKLPASSQGAFIPAGNLHDAMVGVGKVLQLAANDLFIIDPYMDDKVLSDFAAQAAENVRLRLLADAKDHKTTLKPAVTRWGAQYTSNRPIEARLASARTLHDRLILVDGKEAYVLTQSFSQLAVRASASLVRANEEMATLKIAAYEQIWNNATSL